jgi:hypothetical protein
LAVALVKAALASSEIDINDTYIVDLLSGSAFAVSLGRQ